MKRRIFINTAMAYFADPDSSTNGSDCGTSIGAHVDDPTVDGLEHITIIMMVQLPLRA